MAIGEVITNMAGAAIDIPRGSAHRIANPGGKELRCIWAITPPTV